MKKMIVVVAVLCLAISANAQTWKEWFRQKKTQINYLLEQVSALKAYESVVRKGYVLAKDGLGRIALGQAGDLDLHREHYASLLLVSSGVRETKIIESILRRQNGTLALYLECKKLLSKDTVFSTGEKAYFLSVLTGILRESTGTGEEALRLQANGSYQMNGAERIKRLLSLAEEMKDVYVFAAGFKRIVFVAALGRVRDGRDLKRVRSMY